MFGLRGKAALVTGSTSGIGLAVARALAAEGCHVVMNGLGPWQGAHSAVCAARLDPGTSVEFHGADMAKPAEIEDMVKFAGDKCGGVDILVNSAGIQNMQPIEEFPVDMWERILAINLTALFHTTRLTLPHMRKKDWGRIINLAFVHGLVASVNKAAYVAAKHGVVGLTKATALETAATGVTCNAVCPGWVLTPIIEAQIEIVAKRDNIPRELALERLVGEKQPSRQAMRAEDLSALILFLCSNSAQQIRGTAYAMDGGWTAQ